MAGRKKVEGAPVSARTLQRRAKQAEAAKLATKAAPATKPEKVKAAKPKTARKVKAPVHTGHIDARSPEMVLVDKLLLARLTLAIETAPPTIDAIVEIARARSMLPYGI